VGVTTGLYEPPKRILVVCSSHSRGLYLSEFAEPYNILRKKFGGKEGIELIIASPKGGSVSFISSYLNLYLNFDRYQLIPHPIPVRMLNVMNGHQQYVFYLKHHILC
jgi:hypothetical protein